MDYKFKKVFIISYFYLKYIQNVRRKHRFWVRPMFIRRPVQGDGENLINELRMGDLQYHTNYLRMSPECFDVLLGIVGPKLTKTYLIRQPISAKVRLALTLRFLASGDSMISLTYAYRIGKSTVCNIIHECLDIIWKCLHSKVFITPDKDSWIKVAEEFNYQWNFPNCIGAIDGKHITMEAPAHSGSIFYNYKGHHSTVLMAACDANYFFTMVDIGSPGRLSDGGIFRKSIFGQMLESNTLQLPQPNVLPKGGPILPYVFVGDEAFQLTTYMMRPYPQRSELIKEKRVFNYRLSRARRVIENTFGIFAAKWRVFRKPINTNIKTAESIVQAAVCLHNFVKLFENTLPVHKRTYQTSGLIDSGDENNGEWRLFQTCNTMYPVRNVGSNFAKIMANEIRDKFKEYFCNEGMVEWQWDKAQNADF